MPYISTEQVKQIRNDLKAAFPGCKFSVRRENGMAVNIKIEKATFDFPQGEDTKNRYAQVNAWHYQRFYEENPKLVKFLDKLYKVMNKAAPNYTVSEDADYGSIPKYYDRVSIGSWDKPYEKISVSKKQKKAA